MTGAKHSRTATLALVAMSCGGAALRGPPPGTLAKATTQIVPDGAKCPDVVAQTRPVVILSQAGAARPIGRITATRIHRDEETACAFAEDGAASAARKLGGDAVIVGERRASDDDDGARCVVKVRVYVRGDGEFLRDCAPETVRGVDETGIP